MSRLARQRRTRLNIPADITTSVTAQANSPAHTLSTNNGQTSAAGPTGTRAASCRESGTQSNAIAPNIRLSQALGYVMMVASNWMWFILHHDGLMD